MKVNLTNYHLDNLGETTNEDIIISIGDYDEMMKSTDISLKTPASYFNSVIKIFNNRMFLRGAHLGLSGIDLMRDKEEALIKDLLDVGFMIENDIFGLNDQVIISTIPTTFKFEQDKIRAREIHAVCGFICLSRFVTEYDNEYTDDIFIFGTPIACNKLNETRNIKNINDNNY